jgi:hypothetical protein
MEKHAFSLVKEIKDFKVYILHSQCRSITSPQQNAPARPTHSMHAFKEERGTTLSFFKIQKL